MKRLIVILCAALFITMLFACSIFIIYSTRTSESAASTYPSSNASGAATATVIFSAGDPSARGVMASEEVRVGLYSVPPCSFYLEGAEFNGWMAMDNTVYMPGDQLAVMSSGVPVVLTATWSAPEHTVTVKESQESSVYHVAHAGGFTLPTPSPVEGYSFIEWVDNSTGASYQPGATVIITSDTDFIAHHERVQCTLRFNANGGTGDMDSVSVAYGEDVILPECGFSRAYYDFGGWAMPDGSLWSPGTPLTVTSDMEVSTSWTLRTTTSWSYSGSVSYSALYGISLNSLDLNELIRQGYSSYRVKITILTNPLDGGNSDPGVDVYYARPLDGGFFEMDGYQRATYSSDYRFIDSDKAVGGGLSFGKRASMYSEGQSLSRLLSTGSTIYVHFKARPAYLADILDNDIHVECVMEFEAF